MWAVLTRLEEPKHHGLSLMQKLKLYNGKTLPGFTAENVKQLRREAKHEGMHGISPRYVQDKVSNALVSNALATSLNPFMVMNELETGLQHHSLIPNDQLREHYRQLISVVKEEYTDIVKNEVQRAIAADEDALTRLCSNYIDNVKACTQREKVKNKFTGQDEEPDERLMRSIEERIDIPDSRKDDFRREIMNYIGALAIDGKVFNYKTNERLQKALEMKLFEDQKDTIKLTSLVSQVVDKDTQEKIDIVKSRLIRNYGYNDESATDVLQYVASIFARGDAKEITTSNHAVVGTTGHAKEGRFAGQRYSHDAPRVLGAFFMSGRSLVDVQPSKSSVSLSMILRKLALTIVENADAVRPPPSGLKSIRVPESNRSAATGNPPVLDLFLAHQELVNQIVLEVESINDDVGLVD